MSSEILPTARPPRVPVMNDIAFLDVVKLKARIIIIINGQIQGPCSEAAQLGLVIVIIINYVHCLVIWGAVAKIYKSPSTHE